MIRILFFVVIVMIILYLIMQMFSFFKYRKSIFFRIGNDIKNLESESLHYHNKITELQNKRRSLFQSFSTIKNPPKDVSQLFDLRNTVIDKEIKLYQKIIKLYDRYKEILEDKVQVMKFKEKHGNSNAAEEVSDDLFKMEYLLSDIRSSLRTSYYDQINEVNEVTDLRGSIRHLEELEQSAKSLNNESNVSENLESAIKEDILVLKELVREKL